jgi:hypothetical protein
MRDGLTLQHEKEMTMTNISNTQETFQLGTEAARRWKLAGEHGDAGDANAIVALVHAQRVLNFDATVERKGKDEHDEAFEFDILSFADPYFNNDGSRDTRKMASRTACLAERLFGITELTNAIKQRLARTIKCAIYILQQCADMTDEQLFERVTLKANKLVVPYELVKAEPVETASDNEKAFHAAMKGKPLVLDGRDKNSLAELSRRANPPKTPAAGANGSENKGASFVGSLKYVTAIVQQQLSESSDESEVGLNTDARRELFRLSQYIAAYFAADPLEEEEQPTVEQPEKKAA